MQLCTIAHQAPPSMGFSRQEHWRGLPFPSPGDLPNPGIEPRSLAWQAEALLYEPPGNTHLTLGITDATGVNLDKLGRWWGTGRPGVLPSTGLQKLDTARRLNNNNTYSSCYYHWSSVEMNVQPQEHFINCYFNSGLNPCPFFHNDE